MLYCKTWGSVFLCAAALQIVLPGVAFGQTKDLTKIPGQQATPVETPLEQPLLHTLTAGPFAINATAAAGELFSDNIYVTKNRKNSDWISTLATGLTATLGEGGNQLTLRGGVNLGRYARYTSENYNDYYVGADGRVRLDAATSLFGGASYDWTHESRESPDAVNGIKPTKYRAGDYYAGILRSFTDYVVRVGGTMNTYSYDDVLSTAGIIDNTDRDRSEYEIGTRVGYRLTPNLQPFIQGYWVDRSYDHKLDNFGYRRSSTGYRAAAGISGTILPALEGEAYAGILGQSYDDARFGDITRPDFGMRLSWKAADGTTVRGFIDRSVEETTLVGASGYLRTATGASIEQQVRPDLYMSGRFYYSENRYDGVSRVDHVSDAGLGLKYYFLPNLYVATDYAFIHRTSDNALADFYENRIWFRVGAQLAPSYSSDSPTFTPFADETAPGGFYLAALAGNGTLISAVDGSRGGAGGGAGAGGTLTADFGHNGWEGDLAGGYGALVGRVYLGAELDASLGSQHWLHTGTGGTRIFGVRKLDSYEFAARAGFLLENQTLLYGRLGIVAAQFGTAYTQGIQSVRPEDYRRGLRFGGGIEFPLGGAFSGRMEYTQTSYADYDVKAGGPPGSIPDNFANAENLMRFGVVYHIGAEPSDKPISAFDFGGGYGGVQAGFGSLISQNSGDRKFGQTLDAQRAGSGATGGIFAGYGVEISNQYYFGGELDAEVANTDWNIKRDPTGRIYSVAKNHSLDASLLAGYVFNENTLVYGRLGLAYTQFANKYHDEGGVNYVTPDDSETGLRLGGGVAVPVADNMFFRLDYTWTLYGSYNVNYVTGTDKFRNSENLFRAGIAWKL